MEEILRTLTSEEEVRIFAKIHGFDKGRTDKTLLEWHALQAATEVFANVNVVAATEVFNDDDVDNIDDEDIIDDEQDVIE